MVTLKKLRYQGFVLGMKDTLANIRDGFEAFVGEGVETRIYHASLLKEFEGAPSDHYAILYKEGKPAPPGRDSEHK